MPAISLKNDVQTMAYPAGGATAFILLSSRAPQIAPLRTNGTPVNPPRFSIIHADLTAALCIRDGAKPATMEVSLPAATARCRGSRGFEGSHHQNPIFHNLAV